MYLRTTKRRNADGTEVKYHQLAENTWDTERRFAVAKVVYNFGRADEAKEQVLRSLAASILRSVGEVSTAKDDVVVPDDVELRQSWPYGGVYALGKLWSELGVDEILRAHAKTRRTAEAFERALFAMVANRALSPYSKLYCWEQWLREEVFLPDAKALDLHHLYLAMDFLEDHKLDVEKAVYFKMADLMNADVDVIFYDTTSLHFEIDEEDEAPHAHHGREYEALRKRGHSKNGRGDAPQIVVGLAVTRDGLPVRSWVFSGETNDMTTVAKVKEDLRGWRLGRCVFVGDAGMNSEENRQKLALGNGKYILASRMRAGDEVTTEVLARAGRYQEVRDNLRVKEVLVGDGERRRRYVVCHNPAEAERQAAHRQKLIGELEAELATLDQRAGKAHSKRVCELRTSARYGRLLRESKTGKIAIDRGAIEDASRYDGKWVITSNDDSLTAEDLALGYKQLLRVEQCWRQLKGGLRMRPVFHHASWRIQAHVTISVLALLLERIIEIRAGDTWRNVSAELERGKVIEYDRGGSRDLQTTSMSPETEGLLRKLRVDPPPKIHGVTQVPNPPPPPLT